MKKSILLLAFLSLGYFAFGQLSVNFTVTNVGVTGLCDMDGFGAGNSDPEWIVEIDDSRGNTSDFGHEEGGNNGPTLFFSSGFDNPMNYTINYGTTCPPQSIEIYWVARDDDGLLANDAQVEQTINWPVTTVPGTYTFNFNQQGFNSNCNPVWTTTLEVTVSGTLSQACADEPCDATIQPLQDGCGTSLTNYTYFLDEVTASGAGTAAGGTIPSTSCAYDGADDMFFQVDVPVGSDGFTIYIDDWGGCSGFACYTDITASIHGVTGDCATNSLALNNPGGVTVTSNNGGPHTSECVDMTGVVLGFTQNNSPIQVSGLVGGQTYYVRMTEEDDQGGWMSMAFQSNYLNDNCSGAQALDFTGCNYSASDLNEPDINEWTGQAHVDGIGDLNGDGQPDDIDNCNTNWFSNENMVWYYFDVTAQTAQPISLTALAVDCDGTGGGTLQLGVWYDSNTTTCPADGTANATNGLGDMIPVGCSVGTNTDVTVSLLDDMPPGRYYVVADGDAGAQCVWEFESLQILPVEMDEFQGFAEKDVNRLDWRTLTEINNSHFEIERTTDPTRGFEVIGKVDGSGTTSEPTSYEFIDEAPLTSGYYRLKQVDFDGTYEYTEVIHIVRRDKPFAFSNIFPVPALTQVNIKFEVTQATDMNMSIFNALGQQVFTQDMNVAEGTQVERVDVSQFANGVYTVIISDGFNQEVSKFIKK